MGRLPGKRSREFVRKGCGLCAVLALELVLVHSLDDARHPDGQIISSRSTLEFAMHAVYVLPAPWVPTGANCSGHSSRDAPLPNPLPAPPDLEPVLQENDNRIGQSHCPRIGDPPLNNPAA